MKIRVASFASAAFAALSLVSVPLARAAVEQFTVDPVHSSALFRLKHMNTSYAYGRFNGISGTISYDAAAPESSSVQIKLDATSVDTGNAKRDGHLKGADFFNVEKFPDITFASTAVKKAGDAALDVTGDLTLHGTKKSITIRVDVTGTGKGMDGEKLVGFETTFQIKRSEYGMSYGMQGIGDDVRLTIAIEASQKK